jgi:hypothetical protein
VIGPRDPASVAASSVLLANLVIFVDNLHDGSRIEVVRQITDLRPIIASVAGGKS